MIDQHYIKKIKDLFVNREDVFAVQKPDGSYFKVKQSITEEVIKKHLSFEQTIGVYQLDKGSKVKWICFDYDGDPSKLEQTFERAKLLFLKLRDEDKINPLMEFSGMKGFHIWVFCELTDAYDAKKYAEELAEGYNVHEIFPKQTKLEANGYGNLVKLPLGKHQVSGFYSYFLNPDNLEDRLTSQKDSLKVLEGLK